MAHPGFVHLGTFGSSEHLMPRDPVIKEFENGFHYSSRIGVDIAHHNQQAANERLLDCTWYAPFGLRLRINYVDGGPPHLIGNFQVPDRERPHPVRAILHDRAGVEASTRKRWWRSTAQSR